MYHLYTLHPEPDFEEGDLSRRGHFRAWVVSQTLINHGPKYFQKFKATLPHPKPIEAIPITKLQFTPFRAMDHNQSKVSGNIDAVVDMLAQAAVGDPSKLTESDLVDIREHIVIVNGDMGAFEKLLSAVERRAQEMDPVSRLQFIVFVIGLFHLKMAAADAIWRILVEPQNARKDPSSFMKILSKLHPKDSSKLVSGAKFRQQHESISHVGNLLRLDAWRTQVRKITRHQSLDEWAESKPSMDDIQNIAGSIVQNFIEGDGINIFELQNQPTDRRDQTLENAMRTHNYILLYEELTYALNAGDIGRVETLFIPWIQIFRSCGKHKYGNNMLRFMHSLYQVYPERLR
ncbi:hypothetical protein NLI96_g13148 [Meripilus lineatus]|uniref:DUF6589 domain-containing protein n=1 Tax=Meripilus lineatus TaxID=2056292 RepID=A0AAD5USH2_9APHY|nr:hypothetical protein NLI96_g13148 [Physisporinus lineatus]